MPPMHEAICPLILATMADRRFHLLGQIVVGKLDGIVPICGSFGTRIVLQSTIQGGSHQLAPGSFVLSEGVVEASQFLHPDNVDDFVLSISLFLKPFLVWLPLLW